MNLQSPGFTDVELEEAAISAMMQWESSVTEAITHGLTTDHFTSLHCRALFLAVLNEWTGHKSCDLILLCDRLAIDGALSACGGIHKVTELWAQTSHSPKAMPFYIEILQDRYAKRKVLETCGDALKSSEPEGETLKHDTIERLTAIPDPSSHRPRKTFAQLVDEKCHRLASGEKGEDFIPTGLLDLDRDSPLRQADMPLIAGERKAGKSVLALSILLNVARRGEPVIYFSLEDPEHKVMDRLFAQVSRIPLNCPVTNQESLRRANEALSALPLTIRTDQDLTVICGLIRDEHARRPLRLAVIDYGQLVRTKTSRDRRELEVSEVSRTFRLLAMELNLAIILLSQLNKDGETRESRALEQDCTAMWMLKTIKDQPTKRKLEIPFQRNGESGVSFEVAFLGNIARVESLGTDL